MKKITFIMTGLGIGGMERAFIDLVNSFDQSRFKLEIILIDEDKHNWKNQLNNNIRITYLHRLSSIYKTRIGKKIMRELKLFLLKFRKYDYAIVYSCYVPLPSIVSKKIARKRAIIIHSDFKTFYSNEEFQKLNKDIKIPDFDKVICVSNKARSSILELCDIEPSKVIVVKNLINGNNIINKAKEPITEINLEKKCTYFVHVGRHEEKTKNISMILKAVKFLKGQGITNFKIILVGDGPNHNDYLEYISKNKLNIFFDIIGPSNNPYKYMNLASSVLLTSHTEGHPVVLCEAMVLGKNIITTNVSDVMDEVENVYGKVIVADYKVLANEIKNIIGKNTMNHKKLDFGNINNNSLEQLYQIMEE